MLILRSLNLPPETPDTHDKVRFLMPPLRERMKVKAKEILIDDELRRRRTNKMQMIAEGAEAQRVETAQNERKRKQEEKAQWEGRLSGIYHHKSGHLSFSRYSDCTPAFISIYRS